MTQGILRGPRRQAFLIFSSILKRPFGAPTNIRLNVFGRQAALERVAAGAGAFGHLEAPVL
jgi:hypothetical protein